MRSLVKVLVVLLVCLAGIGLYRGWFSLSSPKPDAEGDKVNFNMSVDKGKMRSDVKEAEQRVKEEFRELKDKVKSKEETK